MAFNPEQSNRIAQVMLHLAPRTPAARVRTVLEYMGDQIDAFAASICLAALGQVNAQSEGERALVAALRERSDASSVTFEVKQTSVDPIHKDPPIEHLLERAGQDASVVSEASAALLDGCKDPRTHLAIHAQHTLPVEASYLPHLALGRARVLIQLADELRPDGSLRSHLGQMLGLAAIKVGDFTVCVEETERIVSSELPLDDTGPIYLGVFRGIALHALGEFPTARKVLRKAAADAGALAVPDRTARCFALVQIYRLSLALGDYTDMIDAGGELMRWWRDCRLPQVRIAALLFGGDCLCRTDTYREQGQDAVDYSLEVACAQRGADTEALVRNHHARRALQAGRHDEAMALLRENLVPIQVGAHAGMEAERTELVHRVVTRDSPALPPAPSPEAIALLPCPREMPAIAAATRAAGEARIHSLESRDRAAAMSIAPLLLCEGIRKQIPREQMPRFVGRFIEFYRLLLDLPVHDHMEPNLWRATLRALLRILEQDGGYPLDLGQARALLQDRGAERHTMTKEDELEGLRVQVTLDPRNGELRAELARALMVAGQWDEGETECETALQCDGGHAQAHRVLGLLHCRRSEWKRGVEHYEIAIALDHSMLQHVQTEYAQALLESEDPGKALQVLLADPAHEKKPRYLFFIAACYAALGDKEKEVSALVRLATSSDPELSQRASEMIARMVDPTKPVLSVPSPPESAAPSPTPASSSSSKEGKSPPHRACEQCGRTVYFVGTSPKPKRFMVDRETAQVSGLECSECGAFSCLDKCTLPGSTPIIRLCPNCRADVAALLPM